MEIVYDMKNRGGYWQSIGSSWKTLRKGLVLTWRHFRKAVHASLFDSGRMDKDVLAATFRRDESETLCGIEKLHCSDGHDRSL